MSQTQPNVPESPNQPTDAPGLPEWAKIPPLIARGNFQFKRDLPRLLTERPGQWVAYSGERCLGFARREIDLYRLCTRLGLKDHEFMTRLIEPWDPDEVDPEEYVDK